jgi:hypothetical protein
MGVMVNESYAGYPPSCADECEAVGYLHTPL